MRLLSPLTTCPTQRFANGSIELTMNEFLDSTGLFLYLDHLICERRCLSSKSLFLMDLFVYFCCRSRQRMVEALTALPHLQACWLQIRGSPPSVKPITSSPPLSTAASRTARGGLLQVSDSSWSALPSVLPAGV